PLLGGANCRPVVCVEHHKIVGGGNLAPARVRGSLCQGTRNWEPQSKQKCASPAHTKRHSASLPAATCDRTARKSRWRSRGTSRGRPRSLPRGGNVARWLQRTCDCPRTFTGSLPASRTRTGAAEIRRLSLPLSDT